MPKPITVAVYKVNRQDKTTHKRRQTQHRHRPKARACPPSNQGKSGQKPCQMSGFNARYDEVEWSPRLVSAFPGMRTPHITMTSLCMNPKTPSLTQNLMDSIKVSLSFTIDASRSADVAWD